MSEKTATSESRRVSRRAFLTTGAALGATALAVAAGLDKLSQTGPIPIEPKLAGAYPATKSPESAIPLNPEQEQYRQLFDKTKELAANPLFRPHYYDNVENGQIAADIVDNKLSGSIVKNRAMMRYFLNYDYPKPAERNTHYKDVLKASCEGAELVSILMSDQDRWNFPNRLVSGWITKRLEDTVLAWQKYGQDPSNSAKAATESFAKIRSIYETPEDRARQAYAEAKQRFDNLIAGGVLNPDTISYLLVNVDDFTDKKGFMAAALAMNKINDVAAQKQPGVTATEILEGGNFRDELEVFSRIAAYYSSPKIWNKVKWQDQQTTQSPPGVRDAIKLLADRQRSWSDYFDLEMDPGTISPDRVYKGVEIYGEKQPLQGIEAICVASSGGLLGSKKVPTPEEVAEYKTDNLDINQRNVEFVITKSSWDNLNKWYSSQGVSPAEWLIAHNEILNEMLTQTEPETPLRVQTKRIIIVDDNLLAKRKEKFGSGHGSPHDKYFFLHNDEDSQMVDNLSPWSFDVHGRWVIDNVSPTPGYSYVRAFENGGRARVDVGMSHEIGHQILNMPDLYVYNTHDKKSLLEGEKTHDVPAGFKRVLIDTGVAGEGYLTSMGAERTIYPWVETAHLNWLMQKYPDYFKAKYRGYMQLDNERPDYDQLSGKPITIDLSGKVQKFAGCSLTPIIQNDHAMMYFKSGDSGTFELSPRSITSLLFHPDRTALTYLLTAYAEGGKQYYLPIPRAVFASGFYMADTENRDKIEFSLQFMKPPSSQEQDSLLNRMELSMVGETDFNRKVQKEKDNVYAVMKTEYQGNPYYLVWVNKEVNKS